MALPLILNRAPLGDNPEDYNVLEDGVIVGRGWGCWAEINPDDSAGSWPCQILLTDPREFDILLCGPMRKDAHPSEIDWSRCQVLKAQSPLD